jgi:Flp pilus assembly protein TadD
MAIRLKPDYALAYLNRGVAKAQLGQHFAAIADFDTAIRLKPDDARAYHGRGLSKSQLERFWEAKQDLRTALKLAIKDGNYSLKASIEEVLKIIDR